MNCKCGDKAVSWDGLCWACVLIRDALKRETRWRKYDRRTKEGKGR